MNLVIVEPKTPFFGLKPKFDNHNILRYCEEYKGIISFWNNPSIKSITIRSTLSVLYQETSQTNDASGSDAFLLSKRKDWYVEPLVFELLKLFPRFFFKLSSLTGKR